MRLGDRFAGRGGAGGHSGLGVSSVHARRNAKIGPPASMLYSAFSS